MLIMLLLLVTIMAIGLMVAVPVWETQVRREKEEELIFRGKQYIEAVRIYQLKNPGLFPRTFEELVEKKCLRRLYKEPMTPEGEWNVILHQEGTGQPPARRRSPASRPQGPQEGGKAFSPQRILIAPSQALPSIRNPQILGVVSPSTKKSFRLYNDQDSYDKWLFFYGSDPAKLPEIIYYGKPAKFP